MRASVVRKSVCALSGVVLLLFTQGGALGQSVIINGVRLATTRPPVTVGGSMLLPLRDVFESLQSEVKWFPSQQKIMAIRGQTTVELQLGRTVATINGRPFRLLVAPKLIGGSTYVPLRFPAEAFGGSVEWHAASRTAVIAIAPPVGRAAPPQTPQPAQPTPVTQAPEPPQPPQPATPPPVVAPTSVEGTLVQVISAPSSVVISVSGSGLAQAVTLGPNTTLTRHVLGRSPQPVRLADAVLGDYALATIAPDGVAQSLDLVYGEVEGTIAGISENNILLKDNTVFALGPSVAVLDQAGRRVALWDVPQNAPVRLLYQPNSRLVYELRLMPAPPQPPIPAGKPSIMLIGLLNDGSPCRAGDVLQVQLQGTAGGTATATLGDVFRDLTLPEVQAGVYRGEFTVRGNTNERNLPLVGNLVVNGVRAPSASTSTRVTIDTTPPRITALAPAEGEAVSTADVLIEAAFDAGDGAPINPASATLLLNGARVRGDVTADRIGYQAQDLPQGQVRAEVTVEDTAGNRATRSWTFSVNGAARPLFGVGHDAREVLTPGSALRVSMRARKPGGIATFDVGDLRRGVPMPRVGTSDAYRGEVVVQPGERLDDGVVTVHYSDPDGVATSVNIGSRVTISPTLPTALAIKAPAYASKVADTIVVRGEAPPRARVRVTITYRLLGLVDGQLWRGTINVSDMGLWETPGVGSDSGLLRRADEYVIKVEQLSTTNQVVATKQTLVVR